MAIRRRAQGRRFAAEGRVENLIRYRRAACVTTGSRARAQTGFPPVLASAEKGTERDHVQALAKRLTEEHRELECSWKRLEAELKRVARGQDSHLDVAELERFVARYRAHAQFEEVEFLPLAETILGRLSTHMAALGLSLHMRHAPKKPATYI